MLQNNRPILPRWMGAKVLAAVWLGLLAYGTLLPFSFVPIGPFDGVFDFARWFYALLTSPAWITLNDYDVSSLGTRNWINDLVLNTVLYAPIGALLRIDGWRRSKSPFWQIVPAVLIVLTASWMLECVQGLIANRFASIQDILANTAGGGIGALIAVQTWHAKRWVVFKIYKRLAYVLYRLKRFLKHQRRKPHIMFAVVFINIAVMGWWYQSHQPPAQTVDASRLSMLPFSQQFERSYDVAAVQISRSMILYSLVAMLLSVQFFRSDDHDKLIWVVAVVAIMATLLEVIQMMTPGTHANGTEPIIAIMGAGFTIVTVLLLTHAVRSSCRRDNQASVAVDRRRVPFTYPDKS